jgi:hypothetical protein
MGGNNCSQVLMWERGFLHPEQPNKRTVCTEWVVMYTATGSDINGQVEKPKLACKVTGSRGITQKELQIINALTQIPLKFQWENLNHHLTQHTGYKF